MWAFVGCEMDGMRTVRTSAVVMRMRRPGRPGEQVPDGRGFLDAVGSAGLPEGSRLGIWGDDRALVAIQTPWARDPDRVLPVALGLLTKLATSMEASSVSAGPVVD